MLKAIRLTPTTLKKITSYANFIINKIKENNICGFIFASKSPSCGIFRVKLYLENGMISGKFTSGVFAKHILSNLRFLPHEEEKRLNDHWLKYNFLTFVYAYCDIMLLNKTIKSKKDLIDLHTKYKFLLMSKSVKNYRRLGRIASFENPDLQQTINAYTAIFLETFTIKTTRKSMFNALLHMYGYLKDNIEQTEKTIFLTTLEDFKNGITPFAVVKKLFEVYIKKHDVDYLKRQLLFDFSPKELSLDAYLATFK